MVQAAVLDGLLFDAPPFGQDGFAAAEVDVSWGEVADALVVAMVIVVVDECGDGGLKFAFEEVVFQENAVLEGLVPAFDLALGLGMHRGAADVLHAGPVQRIRSSAPCGPVSGVHSNSPRSKSLALHLLQPKMPQKMGA